MGYDPAVAVTVSMHLSYSECIVARFILTVHVHIPLIDIVFEVLSFLFDGGTFVSALSCFYQCVIAL